MGADLEALCREAAMICLRRIMPDIDFALAHIPYEQLAKLEVQMDDFLEALRDVEPSAMREVFVEVPDVRWEDVGGLAEVKQRLVEAVEWPLQYPDLFTKAGIRPPKGILLVGPSGLRQDAAGQGHRHRKQGQLHLRQRAGAALQVCGRIGEGRCATSFAKRGRRRPASSSSTRSTRWCPAGAPAPRTRTRRRARPEPVPHRTRRRRRAEGRAGAGRDQPAWTCSIRPSSGRGALTRSWKSRFPMQPAGPTSSAFSFATNLWMGK